MVALNTLGLKQVDVYQLRTMGISTELLRGSMTVFVCHHFSFAKFTQSVNKISKSLLLSGLECFELYYSTPLILCCYKHEIQSAKML